MISVIVLAIGLLWVYPFLWMVGASLTTDTEIFGAVNILPAEPQWDNYVRAWYEAQIGPYFWNTIFITGFTIAIVTVTTAMIGYVISRYPLPVPGSGGSRGDLAATLFLPEGYTIIPLFDL